MTYGRVLTRDQDHLSPSVAVVRVASANMVAYDYHSVGERPPSRLNPVVGMAQSAIQSQILTVSEVVASLRAAGLPITAIAEAAQVERKTVYSWLDGAANVRESHSSRMAQLYNLLLPAGHRDLHNLYRMWSTPLMEGVTLRSLLAADSLDEKRIRSAVTTLMPKAEAQHKRRMMAFDSVNGFAEGIETTGNL